MQSNMKNNIIEIVGWYGVAAILTAYFLLSFDYTSSDSIVFQLLNLSGAVGIIIDAWKDKNYQPVLLNIVWAVIAVIAILNLLR